MKISCVILARNEEALIGECIISCKLIDPLEILVIDDESSDDMRSRAEFHGAKVISHHKKNFAEARNFALSKIHGDWIFYVDADEQISEGLAHEIKNSKSDETDAYRITRVNYYLGKKWPVTEKMSRLFKKSALKQWYGELHESPEVIGVIKDLQAPLIHHTHRNLAEMVENTAVWSETEAKLRFEAGHPPVTWWRIPRVMLPVFFDYYVGQGGWKVGTVGLIESIYQAFSMFITYARLWEMQQKNAKT